MTTAPRTLLYIHIPRTAGLSIRTALVAASPPDDVLLLYDPSKVPGATAPSHFSALPEPARARPRLIFGDFTYGLHEHVPGPARYVTTVRNPLGRVASLYRAWNKEADTGSHPLSISEWLEEHRPIGANNGMVRAIAGANERPFGDCPEQLLHEALHHLDEAFEAVFILGQMPHARSTLGRLIGAEVPAFGRLNSTVEAGGAPSLEPEARRRLAELNELDIRLFKRLLERVAGDKAAGTAATARQVAVPAPPPPDAPSPITSLRLPSAVRSAGPASADALLFMHLAKTGGTSLRVSLSKAYADREKAFVYDPADLRGALRQDEFGELPAERRAALRLVMGHFRFGLHRSLDQRSRYVTVVRDPVDRVVSLYYHYVHLRGTWASRVPLPGGRRHGDARQEQARILGEELSLEDWVFGQRRLAVDNGMTRNIAGRGRVAFGECPDDLLEEAVEHIERHFAALLITEELDGSLPLLEAITGRSLPAVPRSNVNRKRPSLDSIDPRVLSHIRDLNRLDARLYELARDAAGSRATATPT